MYKNALYDRPSILYGVCSVWFLGRPYKPESCVNLMEGLYSSNSHSKKLWMRQVRVQTLNGTFFSMMCNVFCCHSIVKASAYYNEVKYHSVETKVLHVILFFRNDLVFKIRASYGNPFRRFQSLIRKLSSFNVHFIQGGTNAIWTSDLCIFTLFFSWTFISPIFFLQCFNMF